MVFVTGGARSGKSDYAQSLTETHEGSLLYIATARSLDAEMDERIALHRRQRDLRWTLLEEPLDLVGRLPEAARGHGALLLDCVTLWITNLYFHHGEDSGPVLQAVDRFCALLPELEVPFYLVSNELGGGVVPANPMARQFRDLAGTVNQRLAAASDEAYLVVAGLPLKLK